LRERLRDRYIKFESICRYMLFKVMVLVKSLKKEVEM
jgi:hypothetical protein